MSDHLLPPQARLVRPPLDRSLSANSSLSSRSSRAMSLARTFSYQKDKPRLYIVLFSRGGSRGGVYSSQLPCDSYHWAILIGPKSPLRTEAGTAFQLAHSNTDLTSQSAFYEETDLAESPHTCRKILARIAIAKVLDEYRVRELLRGRTSSLKTSQPERASIDSTNSEPLTRSCLSWVKEAWESMAEDPQRPLKSYYGVEEWDGFENRARKYVKRKRQQGRYASNTEGENITWNPDEIPTWNYWENRETTD